MRERVAQRGEIWWVQIPTDPPEKGRRPILVVSSDARNRHERASTVLVVPLSTSIHKDSPTHTLLQPGETFAEREMLRNFYKADQVSTLLTPMTVE